MHIIIELPKPGETNLMVLQVTPNNRFLQNDDSIIDEQNGDASVIVRGQISTSEGSICVSVGERIGFVSTLMQVDKDEPVTDP